MRVRYPFELSRELCEGLKSAGKLTHISRLSSTDTAHTLSYKKVFTRTVATKISCSSLFYVYSSLQIEMPQVHFQDFQNSDPLQ